MTSRSIERLLQTVPFFLALTIGMTLAWPLSAQKPPTPQQVTDALIAKGAQNFDPGAAYVDYINAGLSINEANAKVDELRELYKKWQRAHEKTDPSILHGDWDLGQVYRGEKYPTQFPISNGCRIPQQVTITYPRSFKLTGPKQVVVEPNKTLLVDMELDMTVPTPPVPPFPRPVEFLCTPMDDVITLVHLLSVGPPEMRADGSGMDFYKCLGAEVVYTVTLHAHQHPPVPPLPPSEELSGGKKKPAAPACKNYWDHGDFFPTIEYADPTRCKDDIQDLATQFFDNLVEEEKVDRAERSKYEWLPKHKDIVEGRYSEKELLELKHKAVQQLRGGK